MNNGLLLDTSWRRGALQFPGPEESAPGSVWMTEVGPLGEPAKSGVSIFGVDSLELLDRIAMGTTPPYNPCAAKFDGLDVWVLCPGRAAGIAVVRYLAADRRELGTYPLGDVSTVASAMGCDGTSLWIPVIDDGVPKVLKLALADGSVVGSYPVGDNPTKALFDGVDAVWVVNARDDTVTKVAVADGAIVGTYATGSAPGGIAVLDDAIFIRCNDGITKLDRATGALVDTYEIQCWDLCSDGACLWTVGGDHTFKKLAADGTVLATYPTGLTGPQVSEPYMVAHDGVRVLTALGRDLFSEQVALLRVFRASDGAFLGAPYLASIPTSLCPVILGAA